MTVLKGKGASEGITFGRISIYKRSNYEVKEYKVANINEEINRFENAKKVAIDQLKALYEKALKEVGESNAQIFDIHRMMIEDLDYYESIVNIIKDQSANAEYAVFETCNVFSSMFSSMEDAYMNARAEDVKDVSKRIIKILSGSEENTMSFDEPSIIAADDLSPSETVQLDKDKVLGFVTMGGSHNSHTAILARTMDIPACIGIGDQFKEDFNNHFAIVDGFSGDVYIDPDEDTIQKLKNKKQVQDEQKYLLEKLKGKDDVTIDGRHINLYANIGNPSDIKAVIANDARGIGLFRSEFLYLQSKDYPTEDEQFEAYKDAAISMNGKRVIIRTLDVGADKRIEYFNMPKEDNPAMGYRAIRICLDRKDLFKTQLRALYRASAFGKICIMFPMIISLKEIIMVKEIINEVKDELTREGIEFSNDVEIGVMIETPAAVMISDELAREVDFFSIGTNDLTQYTLAIDRQNENLNNIYDPHHKAILRMIKMTVDNAHKNGIWVGICGELGADESLTEMFLAMGVDELSVSAAHILKIRKRIIECDLSKVCDKLLKELD